MPLMSKEQYNKQMADRPNAPSYEQAANQYRQESAAQALVRSGTSPDAAAVQAAASVKASESQPVKQPGESVSEYVYRQNPEQYGGSSGNAEQQRLVEQARVMQERGGYYDASQEARNRAVYGDAPVEQRKAKIRELGGGMNDERYIATDAYGNRREVSQSEASQIMAERIRDAQGRPKIRTAENQQMARSRGYPEAPGLAWAAEEIPLNNRGIATANTNTQPAASAALSGNNLNTNRANSNPADINNPLFMQSNKGGRFINSEEQAFSVARATYERATLLQKAQLYAGTLVSPEGTGLIGAALGFKQNDIQSTDDAVVKYIAGVTQRTNSVLDNVGRFAGSPVGFVATAGPVGKGVSSVAMGLGSIAAKKTGSTITGLAIGKAAEYGTLGYFGVKGAQDVSQLQKEGRSAEAAGTTTMYLGGLIAGVRGSKSAKTSPFESAEASPTERINPLGDTPSGRATRINGGIKETMKASEKGMSPEEVFERSTTRTVDVSKPSQRTAPVRGSPESTMQNVGNTINNILGGGKASRILRTAPEAAQPAPSRPATAQSTMQTAEAQISQVMKNPFINRPQAPAGSRITGKVSGGQRYPVIKVPTLAELIGRTRVKQHGMRNQYLEPVRKLEPVRRRTQGRTADEIMRATERDIGRMMGRSPLMRSGRAMPPERSGRNPPVPGKRTTPAKPPYTPPIKIPDVRVPQIPDPTQIALKGKTLPEPYRPPLDIYRERPPIKGRIIEEPKLPKIRVPGGFPGFPMGFNLSLGSGYPKNINTQLRTINNRMKKMSELL